MIKAVYTQSALSELDEILARLQSVNPLAAAAVERSVRGTVARIQQWPRSARAVTHWENGNVRAVSLVRYPYLMFYRIEKEWIEILHVRHTSRVPWEGPVG